MVMRVCVFCFHTDCAFYLFPHANCARLTLLAKPCPLSNMRRPCQSSLFTPYVCVNHAHSLFQAMSEIEREKTSIDTETGKKAAEKGRKSEHSTRQMKQCDCLVIFLHFCRSVLFACSLASSFLSWLYRRHQHMLYFWGTFDVSGVFARFVVASKLYFSKMNDICILFIENRNAPRVHTAQYMLAHSKTFSFSQVCFSPSSSSFAAFCLLCVCSSPFIPLTPF